MIRYIIKRLILMIPAILATSLIIFVAMNMTGGDPVDSLAPENATEEQIEELREELGLNDPLLVRYVKYMGGMLRGDLGVSYVTKKDVFATFAERLPATLKLACSSVLIATLVALPLGIYTAIHQNTWKDTGGMVFALFGVSMPNFWLGLMLILCFSLWLGWFPSGGYGDGGIRNLVLPAVTVGLGFAALITRTTRSAMLDVIRQDYMTTARAKGVPDRKVIFGHGLKNALIPIITVIGMQLSNALTGSVLAETVFSWPGVGRLIVDSIAKRDTPMVTGSIIMCCILVCIVNVAVDLVYAFFDPRIKAQYAKKG
ncbi:MAG: ABC transporter permease [Clostridiaceae bacterium]|nr:ABC transporter permease [Clostridiaceae bacterium]